MSSIDISVKYWINYRPSIGVEALHMIGLPGSGKSNMATGLMQKCLHRGELLVMPGDRFCEWRHYITHPKGPSSPNILVPEGVDLHYTFDKNGWFVDIDYNKIDVFEYLSEDKPLLVIYDQHLHLVDRTNLWVSILEQLLNRTEHLDLAIGLLFHEAGILLPESAIGDQWKAVQRFSELFVETRKGLVRCLLVSQLLTEIRNTIRNKCLYKIFRQGTVGRDQAPKNVRKAIPFQRVHHYTLMYGGLYSTNNRVTKFYENKLKMKIIPSRGSMNGGPTIVAAAAKMKKNVRKKCGNCSYVWNARVENPQRCPQCYMKLVYNAEEI